MERDFPGERALEKVLVTGAGGFVGSALCEQLRTKKIDFLKGSRGIELLPEMAIDVVIHLAGRVHVMQETAADPLTEFRLANVDATISLARQAAFAGVKRFIFVSTVKVCGEGLFPAGVDAYTERHAPAPADPYALSKWEAEQGLREISASSGMEVVIVRPPLIYGPGVKANFLSMMRWLNRQIPLPLGAIDNRRSLVGLGNLVDFLIICTNHPAAVNQTFLVSDGEDLSTTELLGRMAVALGRPARLLPVPVWVLNACAAMSGRRDLSQRLCGSLRVDISKARRLLGWSPPVSVDDELRRTAKHFLATESRR